jgi:hypothetical protein
MKAAFRARCRLKSSSSHKGDDYRIGQDRIRFLEIVADFTNVARYLRSLKTLKGTAAVAPSPLNASNASNLGSLGDEGEDCQLFILNRREGVEPNKMLLAHTVSCRNSLR